MTSKAQHHPSAIEQAPDAIFTANDDGIYVDVNDAGTRLLVLPRDRIVGRQIADFVCEEDRALLAADWIALRNGAVIRRERHFLRGDGTTFCGEVSVRRLPNGSYQGIVRDVTGRRLAEDALRQSEARFRKLADAAFEGICIHQNGIITDVNDQCARLTGYAVPELIGRDISSIVAPESQALMRDMVVRRAEEPLEYWIVRKDGTKVHVESQGKTIISEGKELRITVIRDLSLRQQDEMKLRESEEKFSRAFRAGPHAMVITEWETGRYLDVNEGFERLFGHLRIDTIGRTSAELHIWPSPEAREAVMNRLMTSGAVRDYEAEGITRSGKRVTCLLNAELMILDGRRCVVMGVVDITDRKQAEEERRRSIEREMKVREEFTRRLLAAQETERRRIAGELHDSLGQNLLLLKNRARIALAGGGLPPEIERQFRTIEDMAGQAIAEVRQISRDLHPYQIDQLGLTRAIEAMISTATQSTGFPFHHKIEPVDDLFADEAATHLFRIVQECMNNILKHAHAKAARILVERDIHHVRIWAEDDGGGFTPDARGFGITNIEERVHILHGTMKIDSAPGQGTRVEVIIPFTTEA